MHQQVLSFQQGLFVTGSASVKVNRQPVYDTTKQPIVGAMPPRKSYAPMMAARQDGP